MCDGGYDGGYSDPDYYDLEFRRQNPDIYVNDEYMQDYYGCGNRSYQRRSTPKRRGRAQKKADDQFHEEYLRWRRNNPDKIAFFREESAVSPQTNNNDGIPIWVNIIAALIIYPLIIMAIIDACSN